ncbi:TPA: SulP family inorganic anion transporter [Vibrio vulnificus]|uniref:SulP family inorganic anion transporter n=1 Tax=Vibrio vulnificus TaxID=672 RepID=UPI0010289596|nr:SulP family inorganic anion transporter [Vibrio vulnificus]EGR0394440.1 SulP family inorganic anion transporter [Vibrio vulnificus]EHK9015243.1 SulP family inorganic anion transporter [Vibrio vulnificus]EHU4994527.1 SulP family inorganic anion transporter [Vibrio vulnificus]EIV8468419.1 SulP family inorganic anion transporter [Vibrio vulnificus]ELT7697654.1 SulP family inorganic anion transporter [Vibrio vulnificus]
MAKIILSQWFPGLVQLKHYQKEWLADDVRAAFSVVAVALPVAIAYAQLTGVSAIVGLYSCVLPMLVYALMGTSRQLIVGPDAATCAVIAAVVTPLAAGDVTKHWQLVMTMTAMTGMWCVLASRLKLGILADFLSRPILLGLLNGVALTIIVGQFAKVVGWKYEQRYLLERLWEAPQRLADLHWPTLALSVATVAVYLVTKRFRPSWPAAMFAILITTSSVWLLRLQEAGVSVVGLTQGGFPNFQTPEFELGVTRELVVPALNLAMVSFVSMMLTARSFAAKNGYDIDADKEFRALGFANIASAFSQGFAISGADSRTAVNDANGGKSQLVSIIAAITIAVIAVFIYQPLQFIPIASLGVVLIIASLSLLDLKGIWILRKRDKDAFYLASITFVSVLVIGVIPGITLAVLLGLFQFLRIVMRPSDQLLGLDEEGTIRTVDGTGKATPIPGMVIYRFNSPLTYFNAPYFKRRLLEHAEHTKDVGCVVVDAVSSFTHLDLSVMATLADVHETLKKRGIRLILAGRKRRLRQWCELTGISTSEGGILLRADMYLAIKLSGCYLSAVGEGQVPTVQKEPDLEEPPKAIPEVA